MESTHPVRVHSDIDLSWTLSTASSPSSLSLSLNCLPLNQMFHPLCLLLPWKHHRSLSEGTLLLYSFPTCPSTCSHLHFLRNSVLLSPGPSLTSTPPCKQASVSHVLETALLGSSVAFKLPLRSSLLRQIAPQVVDNHLAASFSPISSFLSGFC